MSLLPLGAFLCAVAALGAAYGASDEEMAQTRQWAEAALLGRTTAAPETRPGLYVEQQDYGVLTLRKSVMDTPLQIGQQRYEHGLGTHSVSYIVVRLPGPGRRFQAQVGVDNNYDTKGQCGSVNFVVEVSGKEVFHSDVLRGGQAPVAVDVDLSGRQELALRVLDGGDGPAYDQSDWADASVVLADGKRLWLDELPIVSRPGGLSARLPFSFAYGGSSSDVLLPRWTRTVADGPESDDARSYVVTHKDPDTGLEVSCEVKLFKRFPAVEWLLRFNNAGQADSRIIQDVNALDIRIERPDKGEFALHRALGSTCSITDFLPVTQELGPHAHLEIAPAGGRSSNGNLPFFNVQWEGGGALFAVGWSGQWVASFQRNDSRLLQIRSGMQTTHLKLLPNESIRTPRMLVVFWQGEDRYHGHNLLRRLILDHYWPKLDGKPIIPPVTANGWFVFNEGNEVTEANQLEFIRHLEGLGVEVYWLDAGWFEGGWPHGVGSWAPRKDAFPNGLKPLSEAAHKAGMKFIVWFEPERVDAASRIAREHPEFLLTRGQGDALFNLGDPAARRYLTDLLSKAITDGGIDIYRNDFNIDPLPFWQAADAPDRKGVSEIRYIEGLYEMWDELRRRHPGLIIDNCASGGRRIDLETITRSYPLWRSDTQCCGRAVPVQDQTQIVGLNLFVPLSSGGVWGFDPYVFRSIATSGVNLCTDVCAADFPVEQAKRMIAELKSLREFWLGSYYPLLDADTLLMSWCGYQLHREDIGAGVLMLFRREQSPYPAIQLNLHEINPDAQYEVTWPDEGKTQRMSGRELAHLEVRAPAAPSAVLIRYRSAQ